MKKPTKRKQKPNTDPLSGAHWLGRPVYTPLTPEMLVELGKEEVAAKSRDENLREKLSTIIQRNHVARTTSDQTARDIIALLRTLPPQRVFLGLD